MRYTGEILKDINESNPIKVVEYAVANSIIDKPTNLVGDLLLKDDGEDPSKGKTSLFENNPQIWYYNS